MLTGDRRSHVLIVVAWHLVHELSVVLTLHLAVQKNLRTAAVTRAAVAALRCRSPTIMCSRWSRRASVQTTSWIASSLRPSRRSMTEKGKDVGVGEDASHETRYLRKVRPSNLAAFAGVSATSEGKTVTPCPSASSSADARRTSTRARSRCTVPPSGSSMPSSPAGGLVSRSRECCSSSTNGS